MSDWMSKFSIIIWKNKQTKRSPNICRANLVLPSARRANFLTEGLRGERGRSPPGRINALPVWLHLNTTQFTETISNKLNHSASSQQRLQKDQLYYEWLLAGWDWVGPERYLICLTVCLRKHYVIVLPHIHTDTQAAFLLASMWHLGKSLRKDDKVEFGGDRFLLTCREWTGPHDL